MRLIKLILADLKFLWKYGFILIYLVLSIAYIMLLGVVPDSIAKYAGNFIIIADPMTLGLFLMGAWILLEKSQKTISYMAVSPISVTEYLVSKVLSMSLVGEAVTFFILLISHSKHMALSLVVVFTGAVMCTFIGISVGSMTKGINTYVILSMPFEVWAYLPVVLSICGKRSGILEFFPGYIIWQILNDDLGNVPVRLLCLVVWVIILYFVSKRSLEKIYGLNEG